MQTNPQDEDSSTLQKFQDGYTARDSARLVKVEAGWRFHTLHWAMPVD